MILCAFGSGEFDEPRNRVLLEGLRQHGVQVHFCQVALWRRVLHKVPLLIDPARWTGFFLRWLRSQVVLAAKAFSLPKVDFLLVGYPGHLDFPLALLAARWRGIPVVFVPMIDLYTSLVHTRRLLKSSSLPSRWLWRFERWCLRRADLVVADTSAHAGRLEQTYGLRRDRLVVAPVGADESIFMPSPSNGSAAPVRALWYGKCSPLHGVGILVEAAKLLSGKPIRFRFIGTGQSVEELVAPLGRGELPEVEYTPWVPYWQLAEEIARADICLGIFGRGPQAEWVIPNKIFQALAVGRPVITRDSPAIREFFEPDRHLLVCPPDDPATLAEKILRLAEDGVLRRQVAEAGHLRFRELFSARQVAEPLWNRLTLLRKYR